MTKKSKSLFKSVYISEEKGKTHFCYRTGMTVYEEVFFEKRYMSAGWNTAGYTLNVLESFPTRLDNSMFTEAQSFDIEADGVSLSWDWEYDGYEECEEILENGTAVTHARVNLKSGAKPISATVHTVLDGTDVFSRWIEVTNTADRPININVAAIMSGGIETLLNWERYMDGTPAPERIFSLGYMNCSTHNHEGAFAWQPLPTGTFSFDGKYVAADYRHPMFVLRNNLLGKTMIAELGWTGGYRFEFTHLVDVANEMQSNSRLSFRADMRGQNPIICLDGGESFETPKIHIGMLAGDLDDAVNAMHKHLRRSVFTLPAARGMRGWVVGGMGPERIMDVTASKHFIDTIAAVGGETFIIDAGWYCPIGSEQLEWSTRVGDWYPDPERYPNGIGEVRDYAHSKGLLFGLWLDLERLGRDSKIIEQHPEWISEPYCANGNYYKGKYANSQLNMAIPEAAAWAESEISRVIEEYGIDLFRLDYNLSSWQKQNRYHGKNGDENGYVRYYQNTLAMYERLRKKYPNVVFENCAGGGGRTDVGFVSNFTHTWVSDLAVPPRSFSVTNGMTMALPPEYVDRLVGGMFCHRYASLEWQVRNTIFGRPTTNDYNAVGSETNPEQIEIVKHAFDVYKKHIRPYVDESLIFHHTPEILGGPAHHSSVSEQPSGLGILERSSEDGRHGVIGVFALADCEERKTVTVYPKGIDASLSYSVTLDNSGATVTLTGYEMLTDGIRISLPTSLTSELVIYEAI